MTFTKILMWVAVANGVFLFAVGPFVDHPTFVAAIVSLVSAVSLKCSDDILSGGEK